MSSTLSSNKKQPNVAYQIVINLGQGNPQIQKKKDDELQLKVKEKQKKQQKYQSGFSSMQKKRMIYDIHELKEKRNQGISAVKKGLKARNIERSVFTEQEKEEIRQILKQNKQRQDKLKQKDLQMQVNQYNKWLHLQSQKKKRIDNIRSQHRHQSQLNLQHFHHRKQLRQSLTKQTTKRVLSLKKLHYIHLIKQNQDRINKQQEQSQNNKKLSQLKSKLKIDFQQIKLHDRRYQENMKKNQIYRKNKWKNQFQFSQQNYKKYTDISSRKQKIICLYHRQPQKNILSKIDREESALSARQYTEQGKSYSQQDHIERRKQYSELTERLRKQQDSVRMITQPKIIKQTDSLRKQNNKLRYRSTKAKLQTLLNTEENYNNQLVEKARNLIEQIQAMSKKTKDETLIETINNKIDLLSLLV